MNIIYHLSNSQRKDLLVRGAELRIALPAPPIEVNDWTDWARTMFPADLRPYIRSAEEDELHIEPSRSPGRSLTSLIGAIYTASRRQWTFPVAVVIVRLAPESPRHQASKVQWPSDAIVDGVSVFERHREGKP